MLVFQIEAFVDDPLMSLYAARPYDEKRMKKSQNVAVRYDDTTDEWYKGGNFYCGKVTLSTKDGIWVKMADGEFKFKLKPERYFAEWLFIDEKPEAQIALAEFVDNVWM